MENYIETEKEIAIDSLDAIQKISDKANHDLSTRSPNQYTAVDNTWTSSELIANNQKRNINIERLLSITQKTPIIGRVLIEDEDGNLKSIYITKGEIVTVSGLNLTREYSPMGRLFALSVGSEEEVGDKNYIVLQKNVYRTSKDNDEWDANTDFFFDNMADQVESLRKFLSGNEEIDSFSIFLGLPTKETPGKLKRIVVNQISLKENLMLDEFQDAVFRREPNSPLVLMGPPGTGKTTTLIKKLGLNLDSEFSKLGENKTWYMFTPTQLLKDYLKEAFNRQNISAPDINLWVWDDFVQHLARDKFPILETAVRSGLIYPQIFKEDKFSYLKNIDSSSLIKSYDNFFSWQDRYFLKNLYAKFEKIIKTENESIIKIFTGISENDFSTFSSIAKKVNTISSKIEENTRELSQTVDKLIANIITKTSIFKEKSETEIREYLGGLQKSVQTELLSYKADKEIEVSDDEDDEENEKTNISSKNANEILRNFIFASIKSLSRAFVQKKKLSFKSFNSIVGRYIDFDNIISDSDKKKIADYVIQISLLKSFNKLDNRYLSGLVTRYKAFRKDNPELYIKDFDNKKLTGVELDILILAFIQVNRSFNIEIDGLFRQQLFVDEITDFSPIQLRIMNSLLIVGSKTFFGAGDFNQRLTNEGVSTQKDLSWAVPNIEVKKIIIPYRQSNQLTELSQLLMGSQAEKIEQPQYIDMEGVKPVLVYGLNTIEKTADWLGERVNEIDLRLNGKIPSTAILVNSETMIEPLANALNKVLEDTNINVTPCFKGKIGHENGVRIFSIEYIKGLEFEAVFFVGIDLLAKNKSNIFDKYLYVGASRAATFLGISCSSEILPDKIEPLKRLFGDNWSI